MKAQGQDHLKILFVQSIALVVSFQVCSIMMGKWVWPHYYAGAHSRDPNIRPLDRFALDLIMWEGKPVILVSVVVGILTAFVVHRISPRTRQQRVESAIAAFMVTFTMMAINGLL